MNLGINTMKGAVVDTKTVVVQDVPLPAFDPTSNQLYVKVHSTAQNPKDWKAHVMIRMPPCVEGSDIVGVVEKVGEQAKELGFKVGDRVAAMMLNGGFAEYAVCKANVTFKIPSNISFDEAATVPLASLTAYFSVFRYLKFPIPSPTTPQQPTKKTPILIYGASSAVGIFALQFAKLSQLRVVAVAGKSLPYVKTFLDSDDVAIDYRSPDLERRVHEAVGEPILNAIDAISEGKTPELVSKIVAPGGRMSVVFPTAPDFKPPGIQLLPYVNIFIAYGEDTRYERIDGDPIITKNEPTEVAFGKKGFENIAQWLAEGKLKGVKATVMGGLEAVPEGMERMQRGAVSGEKLVYHLN